jgi:hypothetical protein
VRDNKGFKSQADIIKKLAARFDFKAELPAVCKDTQTNIMLGYVDFNYGNSGDTFMFLFDYILRSFRHTKDCSYWYQIMPRTYILRLFSFHKYRTTIKTFIQEKII